MTETPSRAANEVDRVAVEREAIDHLKALLRLDTSNPPGHERPAAEYIARVLAKEGIGCQLLEKEPGRTNLVARLTGSGKKAPLLLNGHLDVVPADAQAWQHPPFAAVEHDGYVWGRGAVDMKNMVAMSLMTLLLLKRQRVPLDRDVIFAAVADEEAGSKNGSLFLVEQHRAAVEAEFVLTEVGGHTLHVGASRFYPIQVAEKGICWFEISAAGPPGHGSMPHPHNAVARLGRAIAALSRARLPQHNTEVVSGFIRAMAARVPFPQNRALALLLRPSLSPLLLDWLERRNLEQALPLNAMLRNTASPTMLSGGTKINVIPAAATVGVDGRVVPGQSAGQFLDEIRRVVGDDVRFTVLDQHDGTTFPVGTALYDAIVAVLGKHDPGATAVPYMIPGFTDAFAYQKLGAICYGFSPVQLDATVKFSQMYHGHDERIPTQGFVWGLHVLHELVRDFCAAH
ncbi:MAG TPA: M20/M25/M40 family metallo-hydrolase [Polyangia bacterium]|jgi:acetylornithine deacetylase/succinyl-diaminopimelate desuccinylase-like protein